MNHYSMSDIAIGLEEKFSVKITEEMMKSFRDITGDINPMHTDKDECIRGGVQRSSRIWDVDGFILFNLSRGIFARREMFVS